MSQNRSGAHVFLLNNNILHRVERSVIMEVIVEVLIRIIFTGDLVVSGVTHALVNL
jgi:hypothetical protein